MRGSSPVWFSRFPEKAEVRDPDDEDRLLLLRQSTLKVYQVSLCEVRLIISDGYSP